MVNKIKHFFSGRLISIIILLIAIAGRLLQILYFFNIKSDRSFQILSTYNLLKGHGISSSHVLPDDLSTIIYEPMINWPPGYSLLATPFYAIFGHDYIAALMSLDMLFAVLLILVSRRILQILDVPVIWVNFYTLVAGFFIYPFYFISCSDSAAVSFFIIALYFTLRVLKDDRNWIRSAIIIGLVLLVCGSLKYLFMPAVFVIPIFLVVKGHLQRHALMKKAGLLCFFILFAGIATILAYHKLMSGSATYVGNVPTGFFTENLLSAYPFIPAALIQPASLAKLFNLAVEPDQFFFRLYQVINMVFIIFVFVYIFKMYRKEGIKRISPADSFLYISFFTSLAILLLLIFLSMRYGKMSANPGVLWTFIEEPRYYGLPLVLIHLAVFVMIQRIWSKYSWRIFFYVILFLLSLEIIRGVIFDANRIKLFNREEYSWQYEKRFQEYVGSIIEQLKKEQPGKKIIFTCSSPYFSNRVSLYSHIPDLEKVGKINDLSTLKTKEPVIMLVILDKKHIPYFQPFLSQAGVKEVGNTDLFSFYTVYVEPN